MTDGSIAAMERVCSEGARALAKEPRLPRVGALTLDSHPKRRFMTASSRASSLHHRPWNVPK